MNIDKIRTKAEGLVTQLTTKDECEKRVYDAVSNRSWAAHPSLLNEIAEDTFQYDRYSVVMRLLWKAVEGPPRNWRSIAKALILVDHILKHGAEKVVADVQQHKHDIAALTDFSYIEGNLDRGSGVRERASELVDLLGNPDRIRAERLQARDLKAQYSGYSASHMPPKPTSSSRDFYSSSGTTSHRDWEELDRGGGGSVGGGSGGGRGRASGDLHVGDEWAAAYDRSPSPSPTSMQSRADKDRASSVGSDKIDFDAGREEYSGRLNRYQEQERREAAMAASASHRRRSSKDSTGSNGSKKDGKSAGGGGGQKPTGPDLLSGDDPFPASTPQNARPTDDFSSFVFNPQPYQNVQGGVPGAVGWNGGAGGGEMAVQQSAGSQGGQMVPYGYTPGPQDQPQQQQWGQQQQQPLQGMGMQQGMQQQWAAQGQNSGQQAMQQGQGQQGYGQYSGNPNVVGFQSQPQQQQQYVQGQQQQYGQPQQQQQYEQGQQQQYVQPQQQDFYNQQYQQQPFQQQLTYQGQQQQPYYEQQQPYPQQQQSQLPQQPQQQQQQPQQQFYQQQIQPPPQQQQQLQTPPPPPEVQQQQQPAPAQTKPQTPNQPQTQPSDTAAVKASRSSGYSNQAGMIDGDWVPTEVVRAGIAGQDLAAAVGGLRQTGFKPSDVGGGVFSGQGRRVTGGSTAPPAQQQQQQQQQQGATRPPPPKSVEYVEVEEGQELRADTREFQSARAGLHKTGLSSRLKETQPSPPPPAPQQQQQQQQHQPPPRAEQASPAAPQQAPTRSVTGGEQWQGLPQGESAGGGASAHGQRPSWQTAASKLKSTGLMGSSTGGDAGGTEQSYSYGGTLKGQLQQQQQQPQPVAAAPWQQGVAGLRRTGLVTGAGGGDVSGGKTGTGGLDMGRLSLNAGGAAGQPQWRT